MNSNNQQKKKNKKKQNKNIENTELLDDDFLESTLMTLNSEISFEKTQQANEKLPPQNPDKLEYYNKKPVISPHYTDSDNSEDEGLSSYKVNGYHPVHVGEVLLERYVIMQKLGYGHFSTAWLALDTKYGNYVAIKIQKSAPQYIDAAYDEVEILQALDKHNFDKEWLDSLKEYHKDDPEKLKELNTVEHTNIVQLLNSFIYNGQNGKHFCMVFEIVGVTLLELIKRYNYKGIPLPFIRIITKQILIGLDFLHRMCHIIHTDLKPENILVCLTKEELRAIQGTGHLDVGGKEKEKIIKNEKKKKEKEKGKDKENDKEGGKDNEKNKDKIIDRKCMTTTEGFKRKGTDSTISATPAPKILTGKQLRKKKQRFKQKQKKRLEKLGLSPAEVETEIKKIMDIREDFIKRKKLEGNVDIDNFDVDELVERPKISSVPKMKLNFFNENESKNNCEELIEDDFDYLENGASSLYDIDLIEYSKTLQAYLKEKNRILHDENYRKQTIIRNNMLLNAKNDAEKITIIKQLNERFSRRGPEIDPSIEVKICDMGNACWFNHHFSTEIQTRQYRSPEVILGVNYNETSDIWSLACIIFELATGDFLFEPRKGETYSKNDDHLAQFIELLGKMPKKFALSGANSNKYFNKSGQLRRIKGLQSFPLKNVLIQKYHFKEKEAIALNDFMMPMLEYYPEKRISARELLRHPWLNMPADFDCHMSELEIDKMNMIENQRKVDKVGNDEEIVNKDVEIIDSDSDLYEADDEDNDKGNIYDDLDSQDSGDDNPDKILIPNYNNSFAEYGQFVDLTTLDKANPQFDKIMDLDDEFNEEDK